MFFQISCGDSSSSNSSSSTNSEIESLTIRDRNLSSADIAILEAVKYSSVDIADVNISKKFE